MDDTIVSHSPHLHLLKLTTMVFCLTARRLPAANVKRSVYTSSSSASSHETHKVKS